jgi:glutamate 5-kinase
MLMEVWQKAFEVHGINVAQMLLTHDDLRLRHRHLAAGETLKQVIDFGAVPVINENDAVSAAELAGGNRFGDNDVLSAMVASFTQATYLIILSTAPGLIDREGSGKVVPVVEKITPEIEAMAGGTDSETAVGGMATKIGAARIALRGGCGVFIAAGAEPDVIPRLLNGDGPGTFFVPSGLPIASRKRWIAYFQRPVGSICVNECAVPVLCEQGRSLLAIGVTGHRGAFSAGDIVDVVDPSGKTFARGVAAFSHQDIERIAGKTSGDIKALFPNRKRLEVVHRNDLVLL